MLFGCALAPDGASRMEHPSRESATTLPKIGSPSLKPLPTTTEIERLVRIDPITFLETAIERYEREVHGYRTTLIKHERIDGKLHPVERIEACFREKPFSVRMEWKEGARLARKTLFVAGTNDNQMMVAPAGWRAIAGIVARDPGDAIARRSSRYPVTEFGLQMGSKRTLRAWKAARERDELRITFHGVKKLAELDDRPCWEVKRVETPGIDPDGIVTSTFWFDTQTWLQLGSVLHDEHGQLVGSYYFRDLELNPAFPDDTFTRDGLKK
jgi:hypothetical protein